MATETNAEIVAANVRVFRIDLETPPHKRWNHIVWCYHDEILELFENILSLYNEGEATDDDTKAFYKQLSVGVSENMIAMGCESYLNEMKGIANALKLDSICNVLLCHLLYEFACGCTSIVMKNKNENLILGRTLDWIDFDCLRKLTIDITVYQNNKLIYRFTTFAGYIGALTGIQYKSKFGFAVNFRSQSTNGNNNDNNEIELPKPNLPVGLLGRYILDNSINYDDSVLYCRNVTLMAPTYFTIVTEKNGCQITRNEANDINPIFICLNDNNSHLIQTNIDHWWFDSDNSDSSNNDDINDEMDSIPRIKICQKSFQNNTCKNKFDLIALLQKYPIYESCWTIYTTIIDVANNEYKTVRFCHVNNNDKE